MMTCRVLTERQEKSQDAAKMSAIMCRLETNGWCQINCDQMYHTLRRMTRDGIGPKGDPNWRYIAAIDR